MSGGGSAPTSQTVTQTTVPEYLRPYVEEMAGQARGLAQYEIESGYKPYLGQRFAGFSPMQAQAFQNVAGQQVSPQLTDASNLAFGAGATGLQAAGQGAMLGQQAGLYGGMGAEYGALGGAIGSRGVTAAEQAFGMAPTAAQIGAQGSAAAQQTAQAAQQAAGLYGGLGAGFGSQAAGMAGMGYGAGQQYAQQATSPQAMQAYMSPYMQNVVEAQQREARRASDIQRNVNQATAVQQGAYGGSRQAIVEAERQRNLATQLGDIQAAGLQKAYQDAQAAQQFGASLGLQGLQAGTQAQLAGIQGAGLGLQGVGQQIAGGQLGLAGTGQALSGLQTGYQGLQTGYQGLQTGLAGTAQGISGAQAGLQGVQGAIGAGQYGLAGAGAATGAAQALGGLGGQQFEQQMAITDAMQKYGALQQQQQQQALDYQYQQYLAEQNLPYQQLAYFSDMIRGLPLSQSSTSVYGGQPDVASQLGGLALAGAGYAMRSAEGGQVKKYQAGGSVSAEGMQLEDVMGLRSKLRRLSDSQLAAYARVAKDAITLSAVQGEIDRRSKMRTPYARTPETTTAQGIAQRAEAASVGRPRVGMAGGGIVALQAGGPPPSAPMSEEEALSQAGILGSLVKAPETVGSWWDQFLQSREAAMEEGRRYTEGGARALNEPPVNLPEVEAAPPSPTELAYSDESRRRDVVPAMPELELPPQTQPEPPDQTAAGMGTGAGASAGIGASGTRFSTFDQFRSMLPKGEIDPAQQAILNDMQSRLTEKMERAGKKEDNAIYDAMLMAGLAMMGGNSLADGIAKAAQMGGATYMSSKEDAEKAMNAAENAEIAFRQYELELLKGNEKSAREEFGMFLDYTKDLAAIDASYARTAAIGAGNRSTQLDTQIRLLQGAISDVPGKVLKDPRFSPLKELEKQRVEFGKLSEDQQKQYDILSKRFDAEVLNQRGVLQDRLDALSSQVFSGTDTSGFKVTKKSG